MTFRRRDNGAEIEAVQATRPGVLATPDGDVTYWPGDWVVSLPNGDNFVCQNSVFNRKFELATPPGN